MKKAIVIASFGTSYTETRKKTIDVIEKEIKENFKDYEIFHTYTSRMVRGILKKRDSINIPSPKELIDNLKEQGFSEIYIQPTHIIPGEEYEKLLFENTVLGLPLLHEKANLDEIIKDLELKKPQDDTAIVFMGHGSSHEADKFYEIMQNKLNSQGLENVLIGTVEGSVELKDILPILAERKIKKIELYPFMMVAGDHAHNDMAGDEEDSWYTILKNEGYEVNANLKGLGEYPMIRKIIYKSLENTINLNRG
ncbi:sirohydrochlorin cobaltochelatase [Treponema putidum]|uniref:Sirohydrochlorin cobaltochelatase n=1 Tax=Treponema putidum TaxID=221027 RepID=A0AAE9MW70_9SPIR|nr:sirohydrochlorin cobaltochelatase [Treponema putidum]AIN93291.1 cobalt chelatase [Treponema putidum]TWI76663.1 sirohydrochlorin cobaltochelatase [Treponema putidum]UTY29531.1 sirohydrochlorin cobaltochelatase [Treponema putidum]UTY32016.1 sirohydrochlorin cobaltochelatase [Treponema putidum]UTY34393.1 sirohydrochlorin cobaltochelatase [Treponema putidum]